MCNTNSRLCFIDVLTARTTGTICVDFQVFFINFNINIFHLWQYGYCNGRCMHTALCFCSRYTLYAMYTRFKFHLRIYIFTIYRENNLFKATKFRFISIDNLTTPALAFRIFCVHAEQVTCEQCRFITASTTANFDDDVFIIIRVFRQ